MAAERRISMLAFGGNVLVFKSKSLSSKTRDQRKGCEVSLCRLSFNRDSRIFSIRDGHTIHKDGSAEADIVHCCSALDLQQRQNVPCVLLRLCKKRTSAFKYVLYSDVKLHLEFVLPYEMRDNISILCGPTLIWTHESSVFCASTQAGGVKEVQIPFTVSFISELPLRERKIVLHCTQKQSSDSSKVKNTLYFIEDGRTLDGACLVPDAYRSVIQCMKVFSAEDVDGSLKSAVLAVTSMKQLVYFENGLPQDVCALPYERPLDIRMVHTLKNDCLVAVTFDQGHVCAVWKDTFQVVCCWSDVGLLLIDDFLCCGSDQMLLLFTDQCSSTELINNFLLTDLCGITYSCGQSDGEVLNTSDAAQENHLLTVQALESRLQSGLIFLEELQRDAQVKDRLIQQTLRALNDLVSGRDHLTLPPEQEGLVSLWDEDDDDADAGVVDELMQTECAGDLLKVDRVWQRVIGQSLVIGVALTLPNDTSVMNMSVSVVVGSDQSSACPVVNSRTAILPFPSSESAVARITRGVSTFSLLSVTDAAPLLTSGSITCPVMLHYSRRSSGAQVSQHCGQISLRLKDIAERKFYPRLLQDSKLNTEEAREDLLSLKALLDVWCFLIECMDHTLADVQLWLQESLGLQRLAVDPLFTADPSDVTLFHWEQRSPFQAVLSVYCRSDLSVLHFLQSLCDFLPASHDVRLLKSVRSAGGFAQSLETEIHTVNQAVSAVLQSPEEKEELKPKEEESLREAWLREKGRFYDRLQPQLYSIQYSRLTEQLIHTQMNTDEDALMEADHL